MQKIPQVAFRPCVSIFFRDSPSRYICRIRKFFTQAYQPPSNIHCLPHVSPVFIWFAVHKMQHISFERFYAKRAIVKERKGKGLKPKVLLSDEEMNEIVVVDDLRNQFQHVVDGLKENFIRHVSVRSSSGSIENLLINVDGEEYPLNQLAQLSRKSPQLVVINMAGFPEGLKSVLQALQDSGMGLNPQQDGTTIYVPLPKMTKEHRENLAKNARILYQKAKDNIKEIQNRHIKEIKNHKDTFSEDLIFNVQEQIKMMAETFVAEAEKLLSAKQKELLGES